MGKSLPPKATIDLVASYARLRGGDVEIVLAEPVDLVEGETWAELRRLRVDRTVRASLELRSSEHGRRYVVTCPRAELEDGRWGITLHGAGQSQKIDARLLVQGDRPLCLLWGARAGASTPPVPFRARPRPEAAVSQNGRAELLPTPMRRLARKVRRRLRPAR